MPRSRLTPKSRAGSRSRSSRFSRLYCTSCHGGKTPAAQFDLVQYKTVADTVREHPRWALLAERLIAKDMPRRA
jgi:hypothetical protein